MQQGRDHLDSLITNSFADIEASDGYNTRIIAKLRNKGTNISSNRMRSAALSCLAAGIIMLVTYTTGLQYKIINLECKVKFNFVQIENYISIEKVFKGE